MKKYGFLALGIFLLIPFLSQAQSKSEKQVEKAVALLIKGMEDGDPGILNRVADDGLTYGHSGGKVENKSEFVNAFISGASDFVKINISGQKIDVFGKTAIVRHLLEADTNDRNVPGHVKLKIMTVWKKKGGQWKMIARQAVKPS